MRKAIIALSLFVLLSAYSDLALAHGVMAGTADFIAGLLHPLTAIEHVLPFAMIGILIAQNGFERCEHAFTAFLAALIIGAITALYVHDAPFVTLANVLACVIFGSLVALARQLPTVLIFMLLVLFGLTHGYANGSAIEGAIRPTVFIGGVVAGTLIVVVNAMGLAGFLLKLKASWIPIALRVGGSWTTAVGLLVLSVRHASFF